MSNTSEVITFFKDNNLPIFCLGRQLITGLLIDERELEIVSLLIINDTIILKEQKSIEYDHKISSLAHFGFLGTYIYIYYNASMHRFLIATFTSSLKPCVSSNPNPLYGVRHQAVLEQGFKRTQSLFPRWDPQVVLITQHAALIYHLRTSIVFPMQLFILLFRKTKP